MSTRRAPQSAVKSSTKNQVELDPELVDSLDEIIKRTEDMKDFLGALKVEIAQKRETKAEKAIKTRVRELMKGVKNADEAKFTREEKEKFDKMSETEKENYITTYAPKPRAKKPAATTTSAKKK